MTQSILSTAALAIAFALPATAFAEPTTGESSCPPGSWFCAEPPAAQPNAAGKPVQSLEPLPPPPDGDVPDPPSSPPPPPPRRTPRPPPVVVYEPEAPVVLLPAEAPPPYPYAAPHEGFSSHEWGLNLHLQGASFGHGTSNGNAGMGGGGAGLRFKPTRRFGVEADVDFLGGTGYQGESRRETTFTLNGLVFVNPRSRAQFYFLAGFGWSGAHVTCGSSPAQCPNGNLQDDYTYFGGQLGVGLELRLSRSFALNGDVRGFIRARVDDKAQSEPEFTDSYGRTTNTSGGALFNAGMTLYF